MYKRQVQPEGFLDGFPNLIHLLPGHPAQVLPHAPLVDGLGLLQQHHAGKLQPTDALGVVVGGLGRLLAGLGRDGRDDQRGAVVVAGVVDVYKRQSLGLTVVNALTAADSVIIPVQAHILAADDMDCLLYTSRCV